MRPSGTLQSPTTGSLEAMMREADHEDQLAAARKLPRNANVQLHDREPEPFSPAKTGDLARNNQANTQTVASAPTPTNIIATNTSATGSGKTTTAPSLVKTQAPATAPLLVKTQAPAIAPSLVKTQAPAEELPAFVPAPKSLVSSQSAAAVAVVNTGDAGIANA